MEAKRHGILLMWNRSRGAAKDGRVVQHATNMGVGLKRDMAIGYKVHATYVHALNIRDGYPQGW